MISHGQDPVVAISDVTAVLCVFITAIARETFPHFMRERLP